MIRKVNVVLKCIIFTFVLTLSAIFTLPAVKAESREIPNQLVVLYESTEHDFSLLDVDHDKVNAVEKISDYVDVVYLRSQKDAPEMIRALEKCEEVKAVDHEAIGEVEFGTTNDYFYNEQASYLNNIGFNSISPGDNEVKVAVVDSGVNSNHPDLEGRVENSGYNYIDNNEITSDKQKHGTMVSGIICANSNNQIGITGACGTAKVKIVPYVVVKENGIGELSKLLSALIAIAERTDIKVINLSLGFDDPNDLIEEACKTLANYGKIIVVASGNENRSTLSYPAAYDSTISVGAVDNAKRRCVVGTGWESGGSNYGENLDLVAPGDDIISTVNNNEYAKGDGTSFAAPFVSAACALALTKVDQLNVNTVRSAIIGSSEDLPSQGWDRETGYGLLQLDDFVNELTSNTETIDTDVTDVIINEGETLNLEVGQTKKLTARLQPDGITKEVSWTSTNSNVVKVDQLGNITAKRIGQETITARCGDKSDSIIVTVLNPALKGITINGSRSIDLIVNKTTYLSATLRPIGAVGSISWSSSDSGVASVDNSGTVKGNRVGTCSITATCEGYADSISVKVIKDSSATPSTPIFIPTPPAPSIPSLPITPPPTDSNKVTGIEITGDKTYELKPNAKVKLTAKLKPSGATGTINWTSSDSDVATVDKNGNVTAKGAGKCTITAECGGFKATVTVNVEKEDPKVTGIKISGSSNIEVALGAKTKLSAVLEPAGAKGTVSWSSSNTGVATIDSSGNITTVKVGTTTITASCGSVKDTVTLTVKSSTPQPTPTPSPSPKPNPDSEAPVKTVSIYRLYNAENNEHLYTSDLHEAQVLAQNGWKDEGIGWSSPESGDPVYRLYSPVTNEHHYTRDSNEVSVLSQQGWSVDNNSQPLFYSGGNKSIFRLYHEGTRRHHLTTDENEYNVLQSQGWNAEGTALYSID